MVIGSDLTMPHYSFRERIWGPFLTEARRRCSGAASVSQPYFSDAVQGPGLPGAGLFLALGCAAASRLNPTLYNLKVGYPTKPTGR
jgi:hypothetical protein